MKCPSPPPGLEWFKELIGGWVCIAERVNGLAILCDDDGIPKGLPFTLRREDGQPLVGPLVVAHMLNEGNEHETYAGLYPLQAKEIVENLQAQGFTLTADEEANAWLHQLH